MICRNVYPKIHTMQKTSRAKEKNDASSGPNKPSTQQVIDLTSGDVNNIGSSVAHERQLRKKTVVRSDHWMKGYKKPAKRLLAMLHVNYQIREEVLPIFFANNTVEIHERSVDMRKTRNWIAGMPQRHLLLVHNVLIRIKENIGQRVFSNPVGWL